MMKIPIHPLEIFSIKTSTDFENIAFKIFRFQAANNAVYKKFLSYLQINPEKIDSLEQIPFLPIEFFKQHTITSVPPPYTKYFKSSGTSGMQRSIHAVKDLNLYEQSFTKSFELFFGDISQYTILALLPSYIEQGESSLVYMTEKLIEKTQKKQSGFYLYNTSDLIETIQKLEQKKQPTLLLGVSYALLDLAQQFQMDLKHTLIMETGGMKGRKKELLREDLHNRLKKAWGVSQIYSEYGMTELLTQSYSLGNGIFQSPPWKRVLIRDTEDPLSYLPLEKTGGINIIDLANIYSCSFIATQDLGKKTAENSFEILGRFDNSDIRGCNLLVIS